MPEPGKAMTPFGRRFSSSSFAAERGGPSVAAPVGPAHDLVDAVPLGPLRGDLLDAGSAAVHQHQVVVLRLRLVEAADDGAGVGDGLAAGDGDQGAAGQVRAGLAILLRPDVVAGVDGGGGKLAGLRGVRAVARAPDFAGEAAVLLGRRVAHLTSKASRRSPRLRARSVTSSSSRALISVPSWARSRSRISGVSLSTPRSRRCIWACSMLTKPQSRLSRSSAIWKPSGATPSATMRKAFADRGGSVVLVPDVPGIELAGLGRGAVEGGVLADGCGDGLRGEGVDIEGHELAP